MDLLDQMRGTFPKTIDKSKPVFSSIIANPEGTASLQKQVIDILKYMKEWISTPNIYEQTGDMLSKSATFFTFLERGVDESDTVYKHRISAIFVRNHDKRWGTPVDIKNVFKQYFPHANIYLVENTNKIDAVEPGMGNLFEDGDIDTTSPSGWTLVNCSATAAARFSQTYGIEMNQAGGSLSQSVNVSASSAYFIHFFLKGKISVVIKDSANKYWNYTTQTWSNSEVNNTFESEDWDNESLFFITNSGVSSVTVYFKYVDSLTYIDYFRLFAKQKYSSFTVIAQFEGGTAINAFGLAAGDSDPNIETTSPTPPQPRYSNYGYYDYSFLSGVPAGFAKDVYEDLMDYLRSQGVKAYLDIVIRDY